MAFSSRDTASEAVRTLMAYDYVLEPPTSETGESGTTGWCAWYIELIVTRLYYIIFIVNNQRAFCLETFIIGAGSIRNGSHDYYVDCKHIQHLYQRKLF